MSVYEFSAKTIRGEEQPLSAYRGHVLLIVNTASRCGFTPQYQELQQLYDEYQNRGFVVLGFPCNQFGGQEPGTEEEIEQFCQLNYGVTFPLFAKVDVNGGSAHPLFQHLKEQAPGALGTKTIKWNFTKFLVDRNGQVVARFAPQTKPSELKEEIEKLL
ncbi:glutathione peroxidase [Geobacillus sp. 46C-IIa]|uniref:glutathione peroxidase n=1 Tax=Geobacillus sp. 46C-IIa TaxID=1963025 RepID=UPI0009C0D33E|nr:glutathione peroxidase [Geobacillus sp. 46C-IIa]OQP07359.1 glutathione peroxidase [Geobacillus sp. 46C-IIa]QNU29429.1 glutathione peroxidase [Geobacillus sp. 46C-IIa]